MSAPCSGAAAPANETVSGAGASGAVEARFFVTARAEPGLAPRLIEPFAKLGLVPRRVHLSNEDGAGTEIGADLRVAGVSRTTAHLIDKALRRVVGVRQVITLVD